MVLLLAQPILDKLPIFPAQKPTTLAIFLVGQNPASELYVSIKQRQAEKYAISTRVTRLPISTTTAEMLAAVDIANRDKTLDSVIIQLPLPRQIATAAVLDRLANAKDVDNLTGRNRFTSPVVQAVAALCDHYMIDLDSRQVGVIGEGRLVGRPIAQWLRHRGHRPTITHKTTTGKNALIRQAEVIFAGAGAKNIVNSNNTRAGQIIFDCSGVDVDFEAVKDRVAAITPPKGGVGPLTVHFLFENVLKT